MQLPHQQMTVPHIHYCISCADSDEGEPDEQVEQGDGDAGDERDEDEEGEGVSLLNNLTSTCYFSFSLSLNCMNPWYPWACLARRGNAVAHQQITLPHMHGCPC